MTRLNEREKLLRERIKTLQQTAKEQDMLDGGGRIVHRYNINDAIDSDRDWGVEGAKTERAVRRLFQKK